MQPHLPREGVIPLCPMLWDFRNAWHRQRCCVWPGSRCSTGRRPGRILRNCQVRVSEDSICRLTQLCLNMYH